MNKLFLVCFCTLSLFVCVFFSHFQTAPKDFEVAEYWSVLTPDKTLNAISDPTFDVNVPTKERSPMGGWSAWYPPLLMIEFNPSIIELLLEAGANPNLCYRQSTQQRRLV